MSSAVIRYMSKLFALEGTPQEVFKDNGWPFNSHKLCHFTNQWQFKHASFSPLCAQSNNFIERYVGTLKRLTKGKATTVAIALACPRVPGLLPAVFIDFSVVCEALLIIMGCRKEPVMTGRRSKTSLNCSVVRTSYMRLQIGNVSL